jgi:hypothetical protein
MVVRNDAQGLTNFEGVVSKVEFQPSQTGEYPDQYKITIKTDVSKKSGFMYEWVGLSKNTTDKEIPTGSVIERYITEIETVLPEAKKPELTVGEIFNLLVGKKFKFVRKTLGKAYKGNPAKEFWVPQQKL